MSGRRAQGLGTVYRYRSGWAAQVTLSGPGEPRRRRTLYGPTQRDVLAKVTALQADRFHGHVLERSTSLTTGAYLQHWLEVTLPGRILAGQLRTSTLDGYRDVVTHHLTPDLGRVPLASLSPQHIRGWQAGKLTERSNRGRPLSPNSVRNFHAVLRSALADALRDELIDRNPAVLVRPPRPQRSRAASLTSVEAAALLTAARADPLEPLWLVLLVLGLRKGEALALRWSDLDLPRGWLQVRRAVHRERGELDPATGRRRGRLVESEPKTAGSAATIALPAEIVEVLAGHRVRQAAARLAAPWWADEDLVFTSEVGSWIDPRNLNRRFDRLCEQAGIDRRRVHDLRHTAGSLLLLEGASMKVVQETLRHSRMATTADLYAHVVEELRTDAADRMDRYLSRLRPPAQLPR